MDFLLGGAFGIFMWLAMVALFAWVAYIVLKKAICDGIKESGVIESLRGVGVKDKPAADSKSQDSSWRFSEESKNAPDLGGRAKL